MSYLFKTDNDSVAKPPAKDPSALGSKFYNSFANVSLSASARSAASSLSQSAAYVASKTATTASSAASVASSTASSAASAMTSASSSAATAMSSVSATAATSASVVASSAASAVSKKQNWSSHGSSHGKRDEFIENEMYVEYLKDLRMNYEFAAEKVAIFDNFYNLLEPGTMFLKADTFVMDCKKRGYSIQWADAAFRTADVESRGGLNKFEYLFAILSLQSDERFIKNARWIEMRKRLIYTYYDRSCQKAINEEDFLEFLRDLSITNEEPEAFGICNKKWSGSLAQSSQHGGHDAASLAQQLALSNLELVQKKSEFEELHLQYIQLEKKFIAAKMEIQSLKEQLDA